MMSRAPDPQSLRHAELAGVGACALPGLVAAIGAWFSVWPGLAAGALVALTFAFVWVRQTGRRILWAGALAGTALAAIFALMFTPAWRVVTGLVPTVSVTDAAPEPGVVFRFDDARPVGPLHVGPPTKRHLSNPNRIFFTYRVIQPLAATASDGAAPVQAWAVCSHDEDVDGAEQRAEQVCAEQLERADALLTPEWGSDDSIEEARRALGLEARPNATVASLVTDEDVWADAIMPLVTMVVFGIAAVMATRKALGEPDERPPAA